MVLIIGGMGQGKLDFARRELGVSAWSEGKPGAEECVYGLQAFLRDNPNGGEVVHAWCAAHPEGVVIFDEVGCGVTPLDRNERVWREAVGRLCCELADRAEAVYRVHCGVGVRLK